MQAQAQDQQANVLITLQGIKVYRLINGQVSKISEGDMRIGCIATQNVYFMNVHDFYYTLQKAIPFVCIPFETQRTFIFPHIDQGYSAIVVPIAYDENSELDTILKTTVTVHTVEQAKQNPQIKQALDQHAPEIFNQSLVEESQLVHYIQKGGGVLKTGFSILGSLVATGVNKGGEWLDTKVDKKDGKVVCDETKQKVNTIKTTTKTGLKTAGDFLNKVFTPVAEYSNQVISDVSTKIDQGDNQTLKKVKEITKATGQSINTAVGGLATGAKSVGGALSDNTTKLVNKRYGEDYTNTFLGGNGNNNNQVNNPNNYDSQKL